MIVTIAGADEVVFELGCVTVVVEGTSTVSVSMATEEEGANVVACGDTRLDGTTGISSVVEPRVMVTAEPVDDGGGMAGCVVD